MLVLRTQLAARKPEMARWRAASWHRHQLWDRWVNESGRFQILALELPLPTTHGTERCLPKLQTYEQTKLYCAKSLKFGVICSMALKQSLSHQYRPSSQHKAWSEQSPGECFSDWLLVNVSMNSPLICSHSYCLVALVTCIASYLKPLLRRPCPCTLLFLGSPAKPLVWGRPCSMACG